jgi:rod shape-determining protein MreD
MINFYRFISILGILVVQFSVIPRLSLGMFEPDLLLALTVLTGLFFGIETGCVVGFTAGLFSDVNTGILLGAKALSWTQVGFAAALIREKIVFDNFVSQFFLIVFGCLLAGLFQTFFYGMSAQDSSLIFIFLTFLAQAATTALLSYPLIRLLRWLKWVPSHLPE